MYKDVSIGIFAIELLFGFTPNLCILPKVEVEMPYRSSLSSPNHLLHSPGEYNTAADFGKLLSAPLIIPSQPVDHNHV